jgi:NAD(P)-dependent dehydrogenase (short-subunit alcohol dehydrogenase family)
MDQNRLRLSGKIALLSGAARGIGAAEARLFAREGAKVAIGDILDDEGKKTEAEIRVLGGEATYYHLDVNVEEDWRSAME